MNSNSHDFNHVKESARSLFQKRDLYILGIMAAIIGGIFFIYHFFGVTDVGYDAKRSTRSVFYWLYDRWSSDWKSTSYAHSHLIPVVSALMVWQLRKRLVKLPRKTCYAGLAVIALSLLLHWAGAKSEQTRLSVLSLIGLSWGIPLFICGWPTARLLIFPCAFLLLSLPLNFFDAAAYPLRIMAAVITSGMLSGLGIEVTRLGSTIVNNAISFSIDLADAQCSIFAVTAIVSFALACTYFLKLRLLHLCAIVCLSIPLLVIANIIRGLMIMLLASAFGNGAGNAAYTYLSGPTTLFIAFGGVLILALISRIKRPRTSEPVYVSHASGITTPSIHAWLITLFVIIMTAAWIPNNLDVEYDETIHVNLAFPNEIGDWTGGPVLFCHNPENPENFIDPNLSFGDPCPSCGEPLYEMSIIERLLLPADTVLKKNMYMNDRDRKVYFTIVLSGKKRSSIHRPEVCLVGPNSEIDRTFIHSVDIDENTSIDLKVLEMVYKGKRPDGRIATWTTYYAYWFAGKNRETPYHIKRMIWMASDRLFHNVNSRWAYISVSGLRMPNRMEYLSEVDNFVRHAYPILHEKSPD